MSANIRPLDPLAELKWNWDGAYAITGGGGHYVAMRRDNGRTLTARSPEELRGLIVEDYAAEPVSRDLAPLPGPNIRSIVTRGQPAMLKVRPFPTTHGGRNCSYSPVAIRAGAPEWGSQSVSRSGRRDSLNSPAASTGSTSAN